MYCLWKTKGTTIQPWREDVVFGAVEDSDDGDGISVIVKADKAYEGRLIFDTSRHKVSMKMPLDWPRINQFPEWFTVSADKSYEILDTSSGDSRRFTGKQLADGIPIRIEAGQILKLTVKKTNNR